jgi:serine/threonine protein kinase
MLLFNRYEYNPQADIAGKGEFSRVYKGIDTSNGQTVAIKIYKTNEVSGHYRSTENTAVVIALDHPGLCRYLQLQEIEKEDSFGEKEKLQVCITEFIHGSNLVDYFRRQPQQPVLHKLVADVLQALVYLHNKGFIHRYIRPSNILIADSANGPVAKLTDFGMGYGHSGSVQSGYSQYPLLSAIPYMSPEQLNAHRFGINGKIESNTDLWSLAAVVYEALTGEPVCRNTGVEFAEAINAAAPGFVLPSDMQDLPAPFNTMLQHCLVQHAAARSKDAVAVLQVLGTTPAGPLLTIEQENMGGSASQTLTVLDTDDDSEDVTRVIKLPQKIVSPAPADDDTRILQKNIRKDLPPTGAPGSAADDTQLISGNTTTPHLSEAIDLSAPMDGTAIPDGAAGDTMIIGAAKRSSTKHAPEEKTNPLPDAGKNEAPGAAEPPPDIIIKKREKPVVLFNRYEYQPSGDLIGKGGFSRVYKAFDKKLSRWVALKIYKTGEFSDRYSPIAEIKRVVNLDHPNICRYLDIEEVENENPFGENEKIQVCVMELLDSGNFADYYKTDKNPAVLKKLVQDILNGLSYLHKNGIIHRDIKPGNILIKQTIEGPVAKITDFGISKKSDSVNSNSSSALIVSIPYMAPEQLNAKRYGINDGISYNLDLWSLGVTIYEVITGKVLFKNSEQDNSEQIMANIMAPELPEKLNDLPQPFRNIVAHCVIKNARDRAVKAEELMVLLNSAGNSTTERLAAKAANTEQPGDLQVPVPGAAIPVSVFPPVATDTPYDESISSTVKLKRLFAAGELEESRKPISPKKKIDFLQLTIGVAVLLFIAFVIYIKNGNRAAAVQNITSGQKADSGQTASAIPLPLQPGDTGKNSATPPPKTDSTGTAATAATGLAKLDKKKEKTTVEKREDKQASTATTVTGNQKYVLKLTTAKTCTITINGMDYGELQNGQTLKVYLVTGKYILHFTNSSDHNLSYTANIEVKPDNLDQVGQFRIPL